MPSASGVNLLGVRLAPWTESQAVDHVLTSLDSGSGQRGGWIVTPNVDILRLLVTDEAARRAVRGATVGLADGMPLVWASRLQGTPLPERVTGASLLHSLAAGAARDGRAVYLVGGADTVAEDAARRLATDHPGLAASGWSPPFGMQSTDAGIAEIGDRIAASGADIVFCGFGFPKQELLISALRNRFPDVWFVGCGAALTFAAGRIDRAPQWMQRSGLEWLHRLLSEPARMFRRYVVQGIPFAIRLLAVSFAGRLRRSPKRSHVAVDLAAALDGAAADTGATRRSQH